MIAHDYSRPTNVYRPHDLLVVAADALSMDCPGWARNCLAAGAPVVVRRAPRDGRFVPVGVRGATRGQRHADCVSVVSVERLITPESLTGLRSDRVPALASIEAVSRILDRLAYGWGITGAVGFELATGRPVCHDDSDLDLVVRLPRLLARRDAQALELALGSLPARCDVQLETPVGAMTLADWAGTADRCLIKSDTGPFLSSDPWRGQRGAARTSRWSNPL